MTSGVVLIACALIFGEDDYRGGAALFGGAMLIGIGFAMRQLRRDARVDAEVALRLERLDGPHGLVSRLVGLLEGAGSDGQGGRGHGATAGHGRNRVA